MLDFNLIYCFLSLNLFLWNLYDCVQGFNFWLRINIGNLLDQYNIGIVGSILTYTAIPEVIE